MKVALYVGDHAGDTVFLGSQDAARWFCNELVGRPFLKASATFSPIQFAAIALSMGRDVTTHFFGSRA